MRRSTTKDKVSSVTKEGCEESDCVTDQLIILFRRYYAELAAFAMTASSRYIVMKYLLYNSALNTMYRNYKRTKVLFCTVRKIRTLNIKRVGGRRGFSFFL